MNRWNVFSKGCINLQGVYKFFVMSADKAEVLDKNSLKAKIPALSCVP